jgi:hypothetical protein
VFFAFLFKSNVYVIGNVTLVLHFRVPEAPGVHAHCLDREDELVVRVGDHAVEHVSGISRDNDC